MVQLEIKESSAAYFQRTGQAVALCTKFMPVGSFDITSSSNPESFVIRSKLKIEERGQALLKAEPAVITLAPAFTIKDYYDRCQPDGFEFPDLFGYFPFIASYVGATDSLRFIPVLGVESRLHKGGGNVTQRIMTITSEGSVMLPFTTRIVWKNQDYLER